jgi:hypothetical protein
LREGPIGESIPDHEEPLMLNTKLHVWTVAERPPGGRLVPLFVCGDRTEALEMVGELRARGRDVVAVEMDDPTVSR